MRRHGEAGFTLIESLVALAILAVSAISLLVATEAHVARIDGLESRALAQFAAENRLAELELGIAPDAAPVDLLGHVLAVEARRTPTEDPDLERIDVEVTNLATRTRHGGFIGFVGTRSRP